MSVKVSKEFFLNTVVGDYINTMKTPFDFNFDLNQTFKRIEYTKNEKKRSCQLKKAFL